MQNVQSKVVGNKLIIEVDLSQQFGLSSTGKTNVVASSGGFVKLDSHPGIGFSINVNKKAPK